MSPSDKKRGSRRSSVEIVHRTVTSEVTGPRRAPGVAVPSENGRTGRRFIWISMLLLLVLLQVLASLVFHAGDFILCLTDDHGKLRCRPEIKVNSLNFPTTAVILALYAPVVLVAFALLAMLLTAYARDRAALRLSMICQAASSVLILTGIVGFLLLNQPHATWENMTIWFYICVSVPGELVITTVLTRESQRRLTSDWE